MDPLQRAISIQIYLNYYSSIMLSKRSPIFFTDENGCNTFLNMTSTVTSYREYRLRYQNKRSSDFWPVGKTTATRNLLFIRKSSVLFYFLWHTHSTSQGFQMMPTVRHALEVLKGEIVLGKVLVTSGVLLHSITTANMSRPVLCVISWM